MLALSHDSANEFWHLPTDLILTVAERRKRSSEWRLMTLDGKPVDMTPSLASAKQLLKAYPQLSLPLHAVYGPADRRRSGKKLVSHLQSEGIGEGDYVAVADGIFVASPELVFTQMASKLCFVQLVRLGYEYCGSFYVDTDGTLRNRAVMTSPTELAARASLSRTPGARIARTAAKYVLPGADSPREVDLAMLLALPHYRGGYNLPAPVLNQDAKLSAVGKKTLGYPTVAPDLCWPEQKVAVEYNGREHFDDERSEKDALRRKALEESGFTVIEVANTMIDSAASMDALARRIAKALRATARLRVQIDDFAQRQAELRAELGLHMQ